MADKNEKYAFDIAHAIMSLFDKENEDNYRYSFDQIDATEFFIGLIKAGAYVYNKLTDDDKNFLEFTHLSNQLIVQDLLEKSEVA